MGTDTFRRVWDHIDGFNKLHKKISLGVENTLYESMSSIRLWTTSKGDLPHCSFIFSHMEPLGAELKNVVCSRSGTMLYLEIQKGKYTMKISSFRQEIRGTVVYMKVLSRGGRVWSNVVKQCLLV